jgi:hypothetical protein
MSVSIALLAIGQLGQLALITVLRYRIERLEKQ